MTTSILSRLWRGGEASRHPLVIYCHISGTNKPLQSAMALKKAIIYCLYDPEGAGREMAPHCRPGSDILPVTLPSPPLIRQKAQHPSGEVSH